MNGISHIVGIDEVGRGPIAGPVAVGVCAIPVRAVRACIRRIGLPKGKDSKKLSRMERERIFSLIEADRRASRIAVSVTLVSSETVDKKGISFAIRKAIRMGLRKMPVPPNGCLVLLDGGLRAPEEYAFQRTIIKGDEREPAIALASIAAKVTRDKRMVFWGKKYKGYGFENHMGYGTRFHYSVLRRSPLTPLHRRSFLSKFLSNQR